MLSPSSVSGAGTDGEGSVGRRPTEPEPDELPAPAPPPQQQQQHLALAIKSFSLASGRSGKSGAGRKGGTRSRLSPYEMRLGLKYAYRWKSACPALRASVYGAGGGGNGAALGSERCPVHHAIIRHHDGSVEVLRREHLPRLQVRACDAGRPWSLKF